MTSPILSEGRYKHDFLKWEVHPLYSREQISIGATANVGKGTPLGIKTADQKYYPSVSGAADGTQNAVAVLMEDFTYAAGTPNQGVAIVRQAIVLKKGLVWDASYNDNTKKAAGLTSLKSVGILNADSGPLG